MIVRTWQGTTRPGEDASNYFAFLTARLLVSLEAIPGYRGAQVLRRDTDEGSVFTVVTRWDSIEAIRRWTGSDVERAVVDQEMRALFTDFDERAHHHVLVYERILT